MATLSNLWKDACELNDILIIISSSHGKQTVVELLQVYAHDSKEGPRHHRMDSLNYKFRRPHNHHHSIYSFFLLFLYVLLSGKTVITPVPLWCIMVSALPTEQWIKLYLQSMWRLDEEGRCLCGVIIITQWSCCHQPCQWQLKRLHFVLGAFSIPPPPTATNNHAAPTSSSFIVNRNNFLGAMKSRNRS